MPKVRGLRKRPARSRAGTARPDRSIGSGLDQTRGGTRWRARGRRRSGRRSSRGWRRASGRAAGCRPSASSPPSTGRPATPCAARSTPSGRGRGGPRRGPRHLRRPRGGRVGRDHEGRHRRLARRPDGGPDDRRAAGGGDRRHRRQRRRPRPDRAPPTGRRRPRPRPAPSSTGTRCFHQRIFAATRNELLLRLHDVLRVVRNRNPWIELKRKTFSENRRLRTTAPSTRCSSRRLRDRDAEGAAEAMRGHMAAIEANLFGRR